jgi:hypothetical protein
MTNHDSLTISLSVLLADLHTARRNGGLPSMGMGCWDALIRFTRPGNVAFFHLKRRLCRSPGIYSIGNQDLEDWKITIRGRLREKVAQSGEVLRQAKHVYGPITPRSGQFRYGARGTAQRNSPPVGSLDGWIAGV